MCRCYEHKCEKDDCQEQIPMHIADFNYEPEEYKVWCGKHLKYAERGSVIFTKISENRFSDTRKSWQCAIKGPSVGRENDTHPNIGASFDEYVIPERGPIRIPGPTMKGRVIQ